MSKRSYLLSALACLFAVLINRPIEAAGTRASAAPDNAVIYFSAAPWDGAAYEIRIPLEKTKEAPNPVIRINIWGNPEFPGPKTIRFSGKEDSSGGPSKGIGRASFQPILDNSWPEDLAGSISFKNLRQEHAVIATYELTTSKGKKFKGEFRAIWGNKASEERGG